MMINVRQTFSNLGLSFYDKKYVMYVCDGIPSPSGVTVSFRLHPARRRRLWSSSSSKSQLVTWRTPLSIVGDHAFLVAGSSGSRL